MALSSGSGGGGSPSDAKKSWPWLRMIAEELEVVVVGENPRRLPLEQPLTGARRCCHIVHISFTPAGRPASGVEQPSIVGRSMSKLR